MIVLVTGGRDFSDRLFVYRKLDRYHGKFNFTIVVSGRADGVDSFVADWASKNGLDQVWFPANWTGRNKSAGPVRNSLMLKMAQPELVIAFPGNNGTLNMIDTAKKKGVRVIRAKYPIDRLSS